MTRTYRVKLIPTADFGITIGVIMFLIKMAMPISGLLISVFATQLGLQNLILWSVISSILAFSILCPLLIQKEVIIITLGNISKVVACKLKSNKRFFLKKNL